MAEGHADPVKEAVVLYQRRGDFEGALALLQQAGWERPTAVAKLRESDVTAARATALLAAALLGISGAALVLWPDGRWLMFAFVAWGVERAFRAANLLRRARAR